MSPKARPIVAPAPPAWDLAFGSAIASDYIFRGITQSNHKPSVAAYFEPRYNINKDLQLYAGIGGASISFPNRAAAEIDFYAGYPADLRQARVRFRRLVLLLSGRPVLLRHANGNTFDCSPSRRRVPALPNGNAIKRDLSFCEIYGKVNYTVTDTFALGAYVYYSPSVLNSGADGMFFGGTAKYTFAGLRQRRAALHLRRSRPLELRHHRLRSTAARSPPAVWRQPERHPVRDYTTWNVGFGWTWKVFTVDLRYIDTDLSKGDCNAFTSDHTADVRPANITPINPGGLARTGAARASSPGSRPT